MGAATYLEPQTLTVEPGGRSSCELHVRNTGAGPDEFRFEILGEARAWASVVPAAMPLPPGAEGVAKILFRLPRSSRPSAGALPFTVRLVPRAGEDTPEPVGGTLQIAPFADLAVTLSPRSSRARTSARHTLTIENRGNVAAITSIRAHHPEGRTLDVEVEPATVAPEPGGSAIATILVRPRKRVLRGERSHRFRVTAEPETGAPVDVEGAMTQEAALPRWAPTVAALVVIATTGLLLRATVLAPESSPGAAAPEAAGTPACLAAGHISPRRSSDQASATSLPAPFNYSFLSVGQDGCTPVRWNPCEPVHYTVNPELAPSGGVDDVHEAFRRIADATGLQFAFDGLTDERSDPRRQIYQPERYGERWAPILIRWVRLGGTGTGGGDLQVIGRGLPYQRQGVYLSGILELNVDAVLDRETLSSLPGGFGQGVTWGRVMLHELGHIIGLGHVESRAQIMHDEFSQHTSPTAEYGIGDLTGLRLIGREAGCLETPRAGTG